MHDIDHDEVNYDYYIDDIQNDYTQSPTQGESTKSSLFGEGLSRLTKYRPLENLGDVYEKLLVDNDENLWQSLFQHHLKKE